MMRMFSSLLMATLKSWRRVRGERPAAVVAVVVLLLLLSEVAAAAVAA